MAFFLFIFALIFIGVFTAKSVKIVRQAEVMIIERLGKFDRILESGFQVIVPFIDTPRGINWKQTATMPNGTTYSYIAEKSRIDLRECVYDFPRQNVITKDNVSIGINALIYFQIVNPKSAVYEIANLPEAIEKLTQTTLRNIIGELDLDETLVSRDTINHKLRQILDEASNKWGVKVNRVELQDVIPPADIQAAMEKQMKAERDRRAAILEAEGLKKAAILEAEGMKESAINRAEGEKQSAVLKAQGEADARIIQADAEKEAIKRIIDAFGENGQPDKYLIAMKYLESLQEMVSGQNNKVVYMPYEATGVLSSVDGIKQLLDGSKK
ncbi:MAG: SPFH domain-containing protein [Candidatus Gastranaerophilaceae bacterium]